MRQSAEFGTHFSVSVNGASQFWPDVGKVPRLGVKTVLAAAFVQSLARRLPFRIFCCKEVSSSTSGELEFPELPVMILRRPLDFYRRLGASGLVGLGESYQAGDWDSDDLSRLLAVFAEYIDDLVPQGLKWLRGAYRVRRPRGEDGGIVGARSNARRHYDMPSAFFAIFLDESMTYSSGIFDSALSAPPLASQSDLAAAQRRKNERLLEIGGVCAGTRVLEIGTGWGELAIQAAKRGASVYSVTLSTEQCNYARNRAMCTGVSDRVRIEVKDYREIAAECRSGDFGDRFDTILSVEMLEHVGEKYWPEYFVQLDRLLARDGRIVLQTSIMSHHSMLAARLKYSWMHKYIFPGFLVPSVPALQSVVNRCTDLRILERYAFGSHYAATIRLWGQRFREGSDELEKMGYDSLFRRSWNYYFAYVEAGFRVGYMDVEQILLARK